VFNNANGGDGVRSSTTMVHGGSVVGVGSVVVRVTM